MGKFRAVAPAPAPGKTRLRSAPAPGSSSIFGSLLFAIYAFAGFIKCINLESQASL